ncbi:MAG: hypothetical protein BMS9Abin34_062 [Patescibacteria group bacterium]|nr:MAG: hypothetical protein BMS9Abin34_062 [Patescibacteria group bacterium]
MEILFPQAFFNVALFEYPELFPEDPVWEAIRRLPEFVERLFSSAAVQRVPFWQYALYESQRIHIEGRVAVGEGTVIYPGAYLGDGVVIGRHCIIGQNVTIRGPVIISDSCVVGPCGEVSHSVFFPEARAAHKNFVGHSIIGCRVNLGAGAETANWKLDGSEIGLWVDQERVQTGLTKLGAVVGDGGSVGGNSVFNPGALLGKDCRIGPLVSVPNRSFPDGTVLKG